MTKFVCLALVATLFVTACTPKYDMSSDDWYTGGTLQRSTAAEWRVAEKKDKLATAAEWAINNFDLSTVTEYETYTPQLLDCIESSFESFVKSYSESESMSTLVSACVYIVEQSE